MAQLPEPEWITLREAMQLVQELTGASLDDLGRSLLDAFRENRIGTRGRCFSYFGHRTLVNLTGAPWFDVSVRWEENEFSHEGQRPRDPPHVYTDVQVNRPWLLKWLGVSEGRDDGAPSVKQVTSTAAAEAQCRQWIEGLAGDKGYRHRNKHEVQKEALKKWQGRLSIRGFNRAWAAAAPTEWKTSGRRNAGPGNLRN